MHLKTSSAKWRPFCLSLNVFIVEFGAKWTRCVLEKASQAWDCCCVSVISLIGQCSVTRQDQTCKRLHFKYDLKTHFPILMHLDISIHSRSVVDCFDILGQSTDERC